MVGTIDSDTRIALTTVPTYARQRITTLANIWLLPSKIIIQIWENIVICRN